MNKVISQREARRLKKRVEALEEADYQRHRSWSSEWPNGVEIWRTQWAETDAAPVAIRTARKLKHAVVAVEDGHGLVRFIACPIAEREK